MTSLSNFNEGQEIIYQDLNKIGTRVQRLIFDRIIYELMGKKTDAFFQGGFLTSRVGANQVEMAAGLGFQNDADETFNPDLKPLYLETDTTVNIGAADPTNDRYDILCVKWKIDNAETESRKFKDEFSGNISLENLVVSKDWTYESLVVAGTPAGSPVVPTTPAGYIKIAEILVEAINGIVSASNVVDKRAKLPLAASGNATGFVGYDAVIGNSSVIGVTHTTLKAALDDAAILAGMKILVIQDETVNIIPEVTKDNLTIEFKNGSSIIKGTALKGLLISANGLKLLGARFEGFSSGGDIAVHIAAGKKYNMIRDTRFLSCDTEIKDDGTVNDYSGNITE